MYQAQFNDGVLTITTQDAHALADTQKIYTAIAQQLGQQQNFAVLFETLDETPHAHEAESMRYFKQWLQQHREAIGTYLHAIAYVVPHAGLYATYAPQMKKGSRDKLFGCPTELFSEQEEARRWLNTHLAVAYV